LVQHIKRRNDHETVGVSSEGGFQLAIGDGIDGGRDHPGGGVALELGPDEAESDT